MLPTVAMEHDQATQPGPGRPDLLERLGLAPLPQRVLTQLKQVRAAPLSLSAHQRTIQRRAASPPTKRGWHRRHHIGWSRRRSLRVPSSGRSWLLTPHPAHGFGWREVACLTPDWGRLDLLKDLPPCAVPGALRALPGFYFSAT